MGVCNCSMFCCTLLYFHSSIAIVLVGKRELVVLLNLFSWCLAVVEWLFLAMPWGCLRFVIVVFLIILTYYIFYIRFPLGTLFACNYISKKNCILSQRILKISGRALESSALPLSHCAPYDNLYMCRCVQVCYGVSFVRDVSHSCFLFPRMIFKA